jgi:hypothetical protein
MSFRRDQARIGRWPDKPQRQGLIANNMRAPGLIVGQYAITRREIIQIFAETSRAVLAHQLRIGL